MDVCLSLKQQKHMETCIWPVASFEEEGLTFIQWHAIYVAALGTAHRTNAPYVLRCGHLNRCTCVAINVYKL